MNEARVFNVMLLLSMAYLFLQVLRAEGYRRMLKRGHASQRDKGKYIGGVFWAVLLVVAMAGALIVWG